jgi:hypothetical protein
MDDATDPREPPVELEVGRRVRGGSQRPFDDGPIERHDDEVLGLERLARDPARLDDHAP